MQDTQQFLKELIALLGPSGCLADAAARAVYARDASRYASGQPLAVALPRDAEQVAQVVRLCARHRVPFVARGAGTGLSGGAVPPDAGLVISLARLTALGAVDVAARQIRAGAGVINENVTRASVPSGLHFAPDPSSESVATIGGNIAENAGGPHCLKLGVTLHHVSRLECVDPTGSRWITGRGLSCERGIDLVSLMTGSEGCLGVVTSADLRLSPNPEAEVTLLVVFPVLKDATRAVVDLLASGLLPAAMEMVDRAVLVAVQEAFGFGLPTDVDAVMIVEFAGPAAAVAEDAERAEDLLRDRGAREVRRAEEEPERTELWKCRKKAFGAVGRLTPNYVNMDIVVPLGRLPDLVRGIGEVVRQHGVRIVTAFHAGDGNLHPGVMYDERDPASTVRARRAADAILDLALARGGSISGEHGIGLEKQHVIGRQLDAVSAGLMADIVRLCDPDAICNPDKALPPPATTFGTPPGIPEAIVFDWDSLTVTAPAAASVAEIQSTALARGFWIPIGAVREQDGAPGLGTAGCIGEVVDQLLSGLAALGRGTARDYLLEIWADTGDGRHFHAGAPVFKNVAGFDLVHLVCGSGGVLASLRGVTFQLKPICEQAALMHFRTDGGRLSASALAALLAILDGWQDDLAGPVCVIDGTEPGVSSVFVLAGGRDRDWDLRRRRQDLRRRAETAGLELAASKSRPFAELAQLVQDPVLPAWVRRSASWTCLARESAAGDLSPPEPRAIPGAEPDMPGAVPWPDFLAKDRSIWQAAPALLWVPQSAAPSAPGWFADTVWQDGKAVPLPAPAAGVPRHLLVGLKDIFDPTDRLGRPIWLAVEREVGP